MQRIWWIIGCGAAWLGLGLAAAVADGPVDPARHWPLPPAELEARLANDPIEVLEVRDGVGGVTGVKKLKVRLGEAGMVYVKWKRAPDGDADGWNNTPRKEIAAYEIQKWFLDPANYNVPTTVLRCFPLDAYAAIVPGTHPSLAGTRCVLGSLTVWIDEVTVPKTLYDPERFANDPYYARHLSDFNVLTYLIKHEDGRTGNFLVSELEDERRVFSIDNGVAFGSRVKNWFVPNWHKLRVPSLRRETVDRLRKVGPEQFEALGVLTELRAGPDGVLRAVPPGPNADDDDGSRTGKGWIQIGLTDDEIEEVQERLAKLLEGVDSGEIAVH